MERKELLIFCSHKSDYLHCVVKIVLIAVLPNIMYHSQSALCCTKASQSVSQGGIFLYEVPHPPPSETRGRKIEYGRSQSVSRGSKLIIFWLSVQDKIGFYHTYNQVRAQSLKQMFIGFMFGLKLWYRSFRVSQASISDRTTCIYKFCLGKVDTVQC